ncbi:uncharacterized protein [Porites lutea]|uniref:uncharacterized protein n=1 Tax=Porites lutea TaxID=51062 RepID=UPI003CC50768
MSYQQKRFYLFNCDNTYSLETVEKLLLEAGDKYGFKISVDRLCFGLQRMAEVCDRTLPHLVMDYAIFVVHADESRLSINEDNAGIGYARLYRALLQKTDNKVLIVIGGDKYYRDEDEKTRSVISRWARRKVSSQFGEEFLDGRQSFIFSWNENHRPIHEEAMYHFLEPRKRGCKFEYTPPKPLPKPVAPVVPQPLPKPEPSAAPWTTGTYPRPGDFQDANTSHRRPFNNLESQKSELTYDLDKGTYEALNMGGSGVPPVYLAGTVLLETYVRYGSISFNREDIFQEEGGWRPTAKQVSDLMSGFKSIPLAKVTFVSTGNAGVSYSVVKVTTDDWWQRCLSSSGRFRPCFSWLKRNYKVCTVACVLSLVVLLGYLWSSKDYEHDMAKQLNFFLFNCDNTYNLEAVEKFLLDLEEKYGFKFSIDRLTFGLPLMAEVCEKTLPKLAMDVAVFVVHANESRLSINEDNAGIGYARLYRALLQKTDNKVLIVIGGDNNYRDEDEQGRSVISRWAKRKVASQFGEEYLDGRQSFIFSWNEKHRPIHEEAMRHYLDPGKRGSKFEYTLPKPLPEPIPHVDLRSASADTDISREDFQDANTPHRRSFNNLESQKSELTYDLDKGTYEALNMGGSGVPPVYLGGTVLLETYVRYGSISFNREDIFQEKGGWRPTAKQVSDLMSGFKSIPLAKVTFVSIGNGGVSYSVVKVTTDDWWERGLSSSGRFRPCFSWLKGNYKVCTVACVLGLVVLLWYLWSSED